MRDDNTPTVTSRRRKPTPHQRLRLEKAKELKRLGVLKEKKRAESKKQVPGETDPEKMVDIALRIPKLQKNTLSKPAKPPAKFRRRQIHKSWLPTHLYHAKRAHLTPPKGPLWRFAIPLTSTEKCYRPTHRAASSRGCVAWDMSYMSTIGIEGVEASLQGLLRGVGVEETMLTGKRGGKWRRGTRSWEGWIKERDGEKRWIAKAGVIWCSESLSATETGETARREDTRHERNAEHAEAVGPDEETSHQKATGPQEAEQNKEANRVEEAGQGKKKAKRRMFLRVHPSAFLPVWNEILKVAKIQRPPAMVEDLRFDIGSIEVIGPGSTEALIGALRPLSVVEAGTGSTTEATLEDEWVDVEAPGKVWPQLVAVTNPASLPANAVLGFDISDPRLHHPPRTVQQPKSETSSERMLDLLSSWPPDQTQTTYDIFDRTKRLTASRKLASQKAVNRRKGEALPGAYPDPSPKDPKIPVLLLASRSTTAAGQGSWNLLLPWDCVLPVWYSLMHYPLSSGGNPRFGGLQEKRQVSFEQGAPWFPGDYPGTKAGFQWELIERERKKQEWDRRPKGKRTEWDSVDMGNGKKGEIGMGWACDWERLFEGPTPSSTQDTDKSLFSGRAKPINDTAKPKEISYRALSTDPEQPPTDSLKPPLDIRHVPIPSSTILTAISTALAPVHLTLLTAGHPTRCARIYRLPTTNPSLRAKWLALASPATSTPTPRKPNNLKRPHVPATSARASANAPLHIRSQHLASTLLTPPTAANSQTGVVVYPAVPAEEDLIGFVTTGNFNLGEGRCEAIGNVAVAKVIERDEKEEEGMGVGKKIEDGKKGAASSLCIIREAGQSLGRLARWKFA